jgi:hypothetical protein
MEIEIITLKINFMAIEIKYSENGSIRWVTQHYGEILGWKMEPMVIPNCARCLGIFIFWRTKDMNKPIFSVTGIHLPPYGNTNSEESRLRKRFYKQLFNSDNLQWSEPYLIVMAGGRIDTTQNRIFYRRSMRHFVKPLKFKAPDAQLMYIPTEEKIMYTSFVLDELGQLRVNTRALIE